MRQRKTAFADCHPAVAFFYFVLVLGTTVFVPHPVILTLSFLAACAYLLLQNGGGVRARQIAFFFVAFLVVAMLNPLWNHYGVTVLFYMKTGPVTVEAILYGIVLSGILFTALLWFMNIHRVMTTDKLVYLFGRLTPSLSLVLSMVFRLVPRYRRRLGEIRTAQRCLGNDSASGSWLSRAKSGVAEISMLLTWALENGVDTADSMRARGYGTGRRTAYTIFSFGRRDKCLAVAGLFCYGVCFLGIQGGAFFAQYNPVLRLKNLPPVKAGILYDLAWLLFLLLPFWAELLEYRMERRRLAAGKRQRRNEVEGGK